MICRAITVRQPWAWPIVHGHKLVENRSGGAAWWRYRGLLLIHAAVTWSPRGANDPRVGEVLPGEALDLLGDYAVEQWDGWHFGHIIGAADLVDIHESTRCCEPWGEHEYQAADGAVERRVVHLVLENARVFDEPVPCRGSLGLWSPLADTLAEVEHQLAA